MNNPACVHLQIMGATPFANDDKENVALAIVFGRPVLPPALSPEAAAWLGAALNKRPGERPTAAGLLAMPWIVMHAQG